MLRGLSKWMFLVVIGALAGCEPSPGGTPAGGGGGQTDLGTLSDAASQDSAGTADASTTQDSSSGGSDASTADAAASDASSPDTAAADAGCKVTGCGTGEFCNSSGNCCPALGCNPNCPYGILLSDKGCDTCQCKPAPAKTCNPLSMSPVAQCAATEFCAVPDGVCGSSEGKCTLKPSVCTKELKQVCGCDAKTYDNPCLAAAAGVSIAKSGACVPPATGLNFYVSCGYPVCGAEWQPTPGVALCTTEQVGAPCTSEGQTCDPKMGCGQMFVCAKSDPKLQGCPKSRAKYKADITYIDGTQRQRLAAELLDTRLATYRYTAAGPAGKRHLGFIIDDQPLGAAVDPQRDMVDLYGYLSLSVATLQEQQQQIHQLRQELQDLRAQCGRGLPMSR